jgi:hypothetical protein
MGNPLRIISTSPTQRLVAGSYCEAYKVVDLKCADKCESCRRKNMIYSVEAADLGVVNQQHIHR